MKTAVINIKTDVKTKNQAKKVAEELGFSLSSLANAYFRTLIKTKEVHFSVNPKEEPSEYMIQALKEAGEDIEAGRVSPTFTDNDSATKWLKKEMKKYAD